MNDQIQIRVDDQGKHQCYRMPDGLNRVDVGPAWDTPRQAIQYSNEVAG